jgi:alkyldihydroxyacetonephosphate synthase
MNESVDAAGRERRSLWAWGRAADEPPADQLEAAAVPLGELLGLKLDGRAELPRAFDESLVAPARLAPPESLAAVAATDPLTRAEFAWGSSYQDTLRGFRGDFSCAPDTVIFARDERDVEAALEWAEAANVALIPFGGGTSVVGGVRPEVPPGYDGTAVLQLTALDGLHELDPVSGSARIGAGAAGPLLERRLAEHGMTLRFFPQSFEFATLGGWIATRAGGHFATGETHIDDLVESVRALTPRGVWESFRLPGSGAGPSPDGLLLGSEGTLGVITEAWVRVRPRPTERASASVHFERFEDGSDAVRALAQSGLQPSNCRLIDAEEVRFTLAGDGSTHLLVLGFESAGADVADRFEQALEIVRQCGGRVGKSSGSGAAGWRETFIRAPYLRNTLVSCGVLAETFETATTWDRVESLRADVAEAAAAAAGREVKVTCRYTHAYADGAAPYFTVLTAAERGEEVAQWQAIKQAVSDMLNAGRATITHHHAVGRDHRPWYDRQRPEPFAEALRAAKRALDPRAVLNPGCLLDPAAPAE